MTKKILIGVGITVVILAALYAYLNYRNRTLSPPGQATGENNGLSVTVNYSRPSVRDRLVFGKEGERSLQPYGKYWRLGANEATEISINRDVTFGGKALAKGDYTLYAIPGEKYFDIRVNTELDRWGYAEADSEKDVLSVEIPVIRSNHVELFTIELVNATGGLDMVMQFSDVELNVPIRIAE